MKTFSETLIAFVVVVGVVVVVGCGDDVGNDGEFIGGACTTNADCDVRCETGPDFPGGTCTVACNTDEDCPDGTHCIDDEGGICLLACDLPQDCRGGYQCKGEENHGHGGDSLVCSGD